MSSFPGRTAARAAVRTAARAAVAVLLGLLVAAGAATGAQAHARLVETVPADGATVGGLPGDVTLTFSDPLDPTFVRVKATAPDGPQPDPTVRVTGSTVRVTVADRGPGVYEVVYRVVSKDGHPVSGRVSFTVAGGAVATDGGTFVPVTPSASAPSSDTPAPTSPSPTSATPTPIGTGTVTGEIGGPDLPVAYLVGLVAVVVALGTAAWAAVARRGR